MKVFISVDAEGISGIYKLSQVMPNSPEYAFCRKMMIEDINAAVRGAFNAGATKVVINDSHCYGSNLIIDQLDPRVELISGFDKQFVMMEGIDRGFDAVLLVGYHARSGNLGVISHTYLYGKVVEARINKKPVAEYELNGLLAGYFKTPVVFISGDNVVTEDAKNLVQGIYTTTTKEAIGHSSALCYHPSTTRKSIEEDVEKALKNLKTDNIKPMTVGSDKIELEIQFSDASSAEYASWVPGVERVAPTTVRYTANNYLDIFKMYICSIMIASAYNAMM